MSMYLGEPRFRVNELEGYSETARGHNYTQGTSFAIVDRAYCCLEVWSDYARMNMGSAPLWMRRFKANQRCAEYNARHAP